MFVLKSVFPSPSFFFPFPDRSVEMKHDFFSFHLERVPPKYNVGIHSIYCYVLKFNATESEAILHDISF